MGHSTRAVAHRLFLIVAAVCPTVACEGIDLHFAGSPVDVGVSGTSTTVSVCAARRWLMARGVPAEEMTGAAIEQLVGMARDAATAGRQDFAGRVRVRRQRGEMFVEGE